MLIPKRSRLATLLVISLFVYSDIICENVLIIVNDQQPHFIAAAFLLGFLGLGVLFASFQSGLSDFFGRRESLLLSFGVSIFSLACAYVYTHSQIFFGLFLVLALALKALWGNTIPISFASIADTQGKNYRKSFALASSSYSFAFTTLIIVNFFTKDNTAILLFSALILLLSSSICLYIFKDASDKTAHIPQDIDFIHHSHHNFITKLWKLGVREIGLLIKELSRPLTRSALFAYTFWETSMYSVIISQIDLNPDPSQSTALVMMIGYLMGVFILQTKRCNKIVDRKMISLGYYLSFFSLIPYFFLMSFMHSQRLLLGACYTLHALGNAFLSPTILSILAKNRSTHDQGKILGLAESSDTAAFLISTIFVMVYTHYHWPVIVLVAFSLTAFSITWIQFPIIRRIEKNIYKTNRNN